jgi:hypothetical protein
MRHHAQNTGKEADIVVPLALGGNPAKPNAGKISVAAAQTRVDWVDWRW